MRVLMSSVVALALAACATGSSIVNSQTAQPCDHADADAPSEQVEEGTLWVARAPNCAVRPA